MTLVIKVIWVMKAAMAVEVDGSLITIITMMIDIKIGEVVEAFTGVVEILAPNVKEVVMVMVVVVVVEEEVLRVMKMKEVDMEKGMRDGAGGGDASVGGGGSGKDGGVGLVMVKVMDLGLECLMKMVEKGGFGHGSGYWCWRGYWRWR
ncbi:hypothetical protein OIU84_014100 [Salix udensis]|uniref:Uncharacterized protein n=1 Tax=Salix udensis TaxID=889485 RepID=A0AAD6JD80_9ROSI|nr:hypothetical protein OIU84_014100 [Salix udensis]